jgi:hypothetical protein
LGPLGTAATNRPIMPAPDDYDNGEVGGMIGRGNRSTRRKPAPVPLCPPHKPHMLLGLEPGAAAVGSQLWHGLSRLLLEPVFPLFLLSSNHNVTGRKPLCRQVEASYISCVYVCVYGFVFCCVPNTIFYDFGCRVGTVHVCQTLTEIVPVTP